MKKLLFPFVALAICCSYPLMVWGQEKTEVPELKVGDTWTYKTSSGNFSIELVQMTEEGYIVKGEEGYVFKGSKSSNIYDIKNLNLKYEIDETKKAKSESGFRKIFDFPLFVGKKWEDITSSSSRGQTFSTSTKYQVEALEEVQTPAGTFKSFRIVARAYVPQLRKEYWMKLWYSPGVNFWVQREFDKSLITKAEDAVLVEYKLKER